MTALLSDYIAALLDTRTDGAHAAHDAKLEAQAVEEYTQRMTPLVDRLRQIVDAMPEAVRYQSHSIEFFAEKLKGRKGKTPNRGELGTALRTLGFIRTRAWRHTENGFRSTWQLQPK